MSDVSALEARIGAALGRIEGGLGKLADAPSEGTAAAAALSETQTQLEEERFANAQLEERVKALKERQDTQVSALSEKVATQTEQLAALDAEMQRLRASNADLRDVSAQLRASATEGATDPELINRALVAEVEALTAQRASEAAEVDAVIATLKPLIEEG